MANKQMTFHESYGTLPKSLLRLMTDKAVTPSEFYGFEYENMSFDEMEEAINNHSPKGYFNHFSWKSERFGW